MNKIFCAECGYKNLYEIKQPKFCAGCGGRIGVIGDSSIAGRDKVLEPSIEVDMREEKAAGFDLNRLKGGIVGTNESNKVKLGDIIGSAGSASDGEFQREASQLPDGEALLQRNEKDCSSSKISEVDG